MSEANVDRWQRARDGGKWALLYSVLALTVLSIVLAAAFTAANYGVI